MFDNPFSMVVAIVAIVMVAQVLKAKYRASNGIADDCGRSRRDRRASLLQNNAEADALRSEVKQLKERVAVLERLATDSNSALEREFAKLKNGD